MVPPLEQPQVYKNRLTRIRRKPQLSDIKEEDELKKTSGDLSTLYLNQEESKQKKISKIKKKSNSKLATTKQKPVTSKDSPLKAEYSKEKAATPTKTKRKVSKNNTKTEKAKRSPEQKLPVAVKYPSQMPYNYVPVIRSFADSDLTSLPLDDIITKRSPKKESKLPKPVVTKVRTKKVKKIATESTNLKKIVPRKDTLAKTTNRENSISTSKKSKVKKNVSKIPKKVNKSKKTADSKKIIAKIPIN